MKYSLAAYNALIDTNLPDNTAQEIDAAATAELAEGFIDSFSTIDTPFSGVYPFKLITADLNASNQVSINHQLGSQDIKLVLYDAAGVLLGQPHYSLQSTTINTATLTIIAGIPTGHVWKGYIYAR